jgi:hypothetical protein
MFMSEQKTKKAGRREFLKLVTAGVPAAAIAVTAGAQVVTSSEAEMQPKSGLQKNEHYKKYLETTRF